MTINFSREKPPSWVYDKAVALFNVSFDKGIIFTVGDTIYSKDKISRDLEALKQIKQ